MAKRKRRRYFVNNTFQYRYIAVVIVPLIILMAGLYYIMYYSMFTHMLIPEAVAATLLPAMKKVNFVLLATLPVTLFLIIRAALVDSNRVVGPVSRLERELDMILAGNRSVRLNIRANDDLKPIVDRMNRVLDTINK